MENLQFKDAFRAFITDLVNQNAISSEVIKFENGSWAITRTAMGLDVGTKYQTKDELIHALVEGVTSKYSGLRAA